MRALFIFFTITICLLACKKQSPVNPSPGTGNPSTKPVDPLAEEYVETEPPLLLAVPDSINEDIGGYYVALPTHYKESSKKYPLLFFLSGAGVFGNGNSDLPLVLKEALPKLLKEKIFPPSFLVNGNHYSFIVMAPQFRKSPDNPNVVMPAIALAKAKYPIDTSRIYLTGISLGSIAGGYIGAAYPSMLAAMVPIAGIIGDSIGCQRMVDAGLPVWAFHNNNDQRVNVNTTKDFVALFNSFHPVIPARLTLFSPFGSLNHDAWTKAMDPGYKEDGKNMYEWMLQYSR